MDIETSRQSALYYGDVTTCSECDGELTWVELSDGTWTYVDGWNNTTCKGSDGAYYHHEPVLNLPAE
jgi:hypothetical protein